MSDQVSSPVAASVHNNSASKKFIVLLIVSVALLTSFFTGSIVFIVMSLPKTTSNTTTTTTPTTETTTVTTSTSAVTSITQAVTTTTVAAKTYDVNIIKDYKFNLATLTVNVGDTVRINNNSGESLLNSGAVWLTVDTDSANNVRVGQLNNGSSYNVTYGQAGTKYLKLLGAAQNGDSLISQVVVTVR